MDIRCIIQRVCGKCVLSVSSSRAKPRDLFRWRQEGECLVARNGKHRIAERRWAVLPIKGLAKEEAKGVTKKISRCARNDGMGRMGLFHVVYNGYVWKTLFPHCHPDRSGGIFLAHRYSAVCGIAENGKPLAKGARNDGVQGRFLAALEMTTWGSVDEQK